MMTHLKLFIPVFLVFMLLGTATWARVRCEDLYTGNDKLSMSERFNYFLKSEKGSSPIMSIDAFLEKELTAIYSGYADQVVRLQRSGIDSQLQSRLKVFDASLSAANRTLDSIQKLVDLNSSVDVQVEKRSPLDFFKRKSPQLKQSKLEQEVANFKACRTSMTECTTQLSEAVADTSKNLVALDALVSELEMLASNLATFRNGLSYHQDVDFFSQIINQRIQTLDSKIQIMGTNAKLEKALMVTGLLYLRSQAPEYQEKVDVIIAKTKDSAIFRDALETKRNSNWVEAVKNLSTPEQRIGLIKNLAIAHINPRVEILTTKEAIEILETLQLDIQDVRGEFNGESLAYSRSRNFFNGFGNQSLDFIKSSSHAPIIIWLLNLTKRSSDQIENEQLLTLSAKAISKVSYGELRQDVYRHPLISNESSDRIVSYIQSLVTDVFQKFSANGQQ